jgi:hypothetical protein
MQNKSYVGDAFRRSRFWVWVCLAYILTPLFWILGDNPGAVIAKFIGNTVASVVIFCIVFSWNYYRVRRGYPANVPRQKTSLKRIFIIVSVLVVVFAAIIHFGR